MTDFPGLIRRVAEEAAPLFERHPIGIGRSGRSSPLIAREGRFKTQFGSGTSGGSYDPEFRRDIEQTLFDTPMLATERPYYGALVDRYNWPSQYMEGYGGWGTHNQGGLWVLGPEAKKDATFTLTDSFGASPEDVIDNASLAPDLEKALMNRLHGPVEAMKRWKGESSERLRGEQEHLTHVLDNWDSSRKTLYNFREPLLSSEYIESQLHGGNPFRQTKGFITADPLLHEVMSVLLEPHEIPAYRIKQWLMDPHREYPAEDAAIFDKLGMRKGGLACLRS